MPGESYSRSKLPISVIFAPYSTGAQNGQVLVTDNGYASPQSANISGTGGIAPGTYTATVFADVSGGGVGHGLQITIVVK